MAKTEVGYLCDRGHFMFEYDEDYGACLGKKIGVIYVEPQDDADSFDFQEALDEARNGISYR